MDTSKNGRWTGPGKKFRRLKVKCALKCQIYKIKISSQIFVFTEAYKEWHTAIYVYEKLRYSLIIKYLYV